jgi:hypothetical protein
MSVLRLRLFAGFIVAAALCLFGSRDTIAAVLSFMSERFRAFYGYRPEGDTTP